MFQKITIYIILLIFLLGCKDEIVPETYLPSNKREAYLYALEQANLTQTALGIDWIKASENSLSKPLNITLPFEEELYWNANQAEATGYRFFVRRGLRIKAEVYVYSNDSILLFTDLYRESGDSVSDWTHVATADIANRIEFEPRRDAYYILRMQPELLRGGRFKILIREVPSIGFPVSGKNSRDIQSFFGAARDGGTREHHGVDIFAPRHTPVVAPTNSTVRRVGVGEIGGNYVWLYDSLRSMSLYFAHLETQEVKPNTRVVAGQVIGTVGNTGNARTTPTHLHFGIYSRGPIDPLYFIKETDLNPDKIFGDILLLGKWVRTITNATIRSSPKSSGKTINMMGKNSVMKVTGLVGNFYRILLPDNTFGYVRINQVELIQNPINQQIIDEELSLLEYPDKNALYITQIKSGDTITILGQFNEYSYGSTPEGRVGWILKP